MPLLPKTYVGNLPSPKYYSTAITGKEGYNPIITVYYGSDNNIVRVKEVWRGKAWAQTISGSNYVQQWPNYTYSETFSAWEETTVS